MTRAPFLGTLPLYAAIRDPTGANSKSNYLKTTQEINLNYTMPSKTHNASGTQLGVQQNSSEKATTKKMILRNFPGREYSPIWLLQ